MYKYNIKIALFLSCITILSCSGLQSELTKLTNNLKTLHVKLQKPTGQQPVPIPTAGPRIAILAWGSLVEYPKDLPLVESNKFKAHAAQGPKLPIDYARSSKDGRLTLVIAPHMGNLLNTFYATFKGDNFDDAINALRNREGTTAKNIGYLNITKKTYQRNDYNQRTKDTQVISGTIGDAYYQANPMLNRIADWAQSHNYTAVIWTDLPPTFTQNEFTTNNLKNYLNGLNAESLLKAYCYFKITPTEIRNGTVVGNDLIKHAAEILNTKPREVNNLLRDKSIRNTVANLTVADCIKIIWG